MKHLLNGIIYLYVYEDLVAKSTDILFKGDSRRKLLILMKKRSALLFTWNIPGLSSKLLRSHCCLRGESLDWKRSSVMEHRKHTQSPGFDSTKGAEGGVESILEF